MQEVLADYGVAFPSRCILDNLGAASEAVNGLVDAMYGLGQAAGEEVERRLRGCLGDRYEGNWAARLQSQLVKSFARMDNQDVGQLANAAANSALPAWVLGNIPLHVLVQTSTDGAVVATCLTGLTLENVIYEMRYVLGLEAVVEVMERVHACISAQGLEAWSADAVATLDRGISALDTTQLWELLKAHYTFDEAYEYYDNEYGLQDIGFPPAVAAVVKAAAEVAIPSGSSVAGLITCVAEYSLDVAMDAVETATNEVVSYITNLAWQCRSAAVPYNVPSWESWVEARIPELEESLQAMRPSRLLAFANDLLDSRVDDPKLPTELVAILTAGLEPLLGDENSWQAYDINDNDLSPVQEMLHCLIEQYYGPISLPYGE